MKRKGSNIFHTSELIRSDREILEKNRWLEEIVRGWYLAIRPDLAKGDSTAWYANFWDFLRIYLQHHYGTEYCLSAECSLDVHVGTTSRPEDILGQSFPFFEGMSIWKPWNTRASTETLFLLFPLSHRN